MKRRKTDYDGMPHCKNYDIHTTIKFPKSEIRKLVVIELKKLEKEHKERIKKMDEKLIKKMIDYGRELQRKGIK